jgi:hypothetical protein
MVSVVVQALEAACGFIFLEFTERLAVRHTHRVYPPE